MYRYLVKLRGHYEAGSDQYVVGRLVVTAKTATNYTGGVEKESAYVGVNELSLPRDDFKICDKVLRPKRDLDEKTLTSRSSPS